jgi:hypothetical protein
MAYRIDCWENRMKRLLLITALVALGLTLQPRPSQADAALGTILASAKTAAGGTALDGVRSVHYAQRVTAGGITGTGNEYDEVQTGSSVVHQDLGPLTNAQGFDGKVIWQQDSTGDAWAVGDYSSVRTAVTSAYLLSYSFLYKNRWPGTVSYTGTAADAAGNYNVVHAQPKGGFPVDIYFDSATNLIAKEIVRIPNGRDITIVLSDYRTVGGVVLPFSNVQSSLNNQAQTHVVMATLNVPTTGKFQMPATQVTDATIAGGTTTVPFKLINNHLYLYVKVNGKGPFLFVFDSGGANVLTPKTAALLGAQSSGSYQASGAGAGQVTTGFSRIKMLQVGGATVRNQSCAVLPLDRVMQAIEGVRIQGMIGYEVLRRFVTTIDYLHGRITFAPATATGNFGTAVPFVFDQTIPLVAGSFDNLTGSFIVDTGNRSSLVVNEPFVVANNLPLSPVRGITGFGIGGPSYGSLVRLPLFSIGPVPVRSVVTTYSQDTSGATTEPGTAGNIGSGLLKRFTVTFAYRRQVMYLQPNANYARPDVYDRSGLVLVQAHGGLRVIAALPATPAAKADIVSGDTIVAVNGAPAHSVGLLLLRTMLRSKSGTQVRLTIEHGGQSRTVTLTLRDYV